MEIQGVVMHGLEFVLESSVVTQKPSLRKSKDIMQKHSFGKRESHLYE